MGWPVEAAHASENEWVKTVELTRPEGVRWEPDRETGDGVPHDWSAHVKETPPRYRPLYEASRETFAHRVPEATIPVERIRSLLLVAGGDDQVWPSLLHAERISERRAARGLATTIVSEKGAGHRTVLRGEGVVSSGMRMQRGGAEAADRQLGSRAWDAITAMLTPIR